jgi:hypothetical protein
LPEDELRLPMSQWAHKVLPTLLQTRCRPFEEIFNNTCFTFDCLKSMHAGSVLDHSIKVVAKHLEHQPQLFKVGVTCFPKLRYFNRKYGYRCKGFRHMVFLAAHSEAGFIEMLESALIRVYRNTAGCKNIAPGGENLKGPPPYFAYLACLTPCPG